MVIRAVCHQFGTGFKTECNAAVSSDLSIIAYIFNTKQHFLRNSRRQFRWNSAADCKRSLSRSHEVQKMINARNVCDRRHFGREFCLWAQFRLTLIIIVCILSLTQQNFYFVALKKGQSKGQGTALPQRRHSRSKLKPQQKNGFVALGRPNLIGDLDS